MSDMLYKLYIMMDEEADIRLQAREEAAALTCTLLNYFGILPS